MRNSEKDYYKDYYNPFFSHIYVEKGVRDHDRTSRILAHFPQAQVIEIGHYKDVFCRKGQNAVLQHRAQSLILAEKTGRLIYEGAPVCQSFGNQYFYYTSCVMNCIFGCEYCYLKGMYPSGNIVVFVNLEDYFAKIKEILAEHPLYVCISYDTDLLALESITGYAEEWMQYTQNINNFKNNLHHNLKIEIRTKCADRSFFAHAFPVSNVIYAFTLSPQAVIDACEHGTPSLRQRLACTAEAVEKGFAVRLCFDPLIYCAGWEQHYDTMLDAVFSNIQMEKIVDASIGTFRVSQDYLKKMRKIEPYSAVVQFPYENDAGVYHYGCELTKKMEGHVRARLREYMPDDSIFCDPVG